MVSGFGNVWWVDLVVAALWVCDFVVLVGLAVWLNSSFLVLPCHGFSVVCCISGLRWFCDFDCGFDGLCLV